MAERFRLKRSLREAGFIVLLAVLVGFVYNAVSPRGIDLIRKERPLAWSSDASGHATPSTSSRPTFIDIDQASTLATKTSSTKDTSRAQSLFR
jgi:hypothetical protein